MKLTDNDIVEMIFFPVVNEACRVLDEGIALKASDLDVASIMGMGFPSYRSNSFCSVSLSLSLLSMSILADIILNLPWNCYFTSGVEYCFGPTRLVRNMCTTDWMHGRRIMGISSDPVNI